MRTRLMWVLASTALAGAGLLGGCASVAPGGPAQADAATEADDGIDHARVQAIERAARYRGVQVVWVNRPRKPS